MIFKEIVNLILILPLISWLFPLILGKQLGYKYVSRFTTLLIMITTIITYYYFYLLILDNNPIKLYLFNFCNVDYLNINIEFMFDSLAITMLLAITTISSMVHLYSIGYMENDPHQIRFFSLLSMFTFWMIILVTGANYLVMLIGWEFIGITSYLLISFWFTRLQAVKSALSAFFLNKFGDTFFIIALSLMTYVFGTLNYSSIFSLSYLINSDILFIIMLCLFIAAMAKSAQLGLHNWLTNAMEGPTPVSSLLHAATLVTAGIYLLIRSSYILEYTPTLLIIILWVGALTSLTAGLIAICSNDIKKVIALSTMSQLGIMVIAIGLSSYNLSLFHLLCHAFFKALLFMSAGSIIHSILNESQDIRNYGSLIHSLPYTYICFIIASFSLIAIPGLTGYYSKEIIIETIKGSNYNLKDIVYIVSYISLLCTNIYSIKLIYKIFINKPNNSKLIYHYSSESNKFIIIPIFILTIFTLFIGWLLKDIYIGIGSNFLDIFVLPNNYLWFNTEFTLTRFYKLLPLFSCLILLLIIFLIYEFKSNFIYNYIKYYKTIYSIFNLKLLTDQLLNYYIIFKFLIISGYISNHIDKGNLYILGPLGLKKLLNICSYNLLTFVNNKNTLKTNLLLLFFIMLIIFSYFVFFIL